MKLVLTTRFAKDLRSIRDAHVKADVDSALDTMKAATRLEEPSPLPAAARSAAAALFNSCQFTQVPPQSKFQSLIAMVRNGNSDRRAILPINMMAAFNSSEDPVVLLE